MPTFYFDFHREGTSTIDKEGDDYRSAEAARADLVRTLAEISNDITPDRERREIIGEMRDEAGKRLLRATMSLKVESL